MSNGPVLTEVDVQDLHFDPENPRLPSRLHHADEPAVLEFLLLECNLIELMLSIGQQGFFVGEPLLVVPRDAGGYLVVEGNRRLGALKLLQHGVAAPVMTKKVQAAVESVIYRPFKVPVLEFHQRDDILTYLGYRHITGIKEWDSLAKARYLRQLSARFQGQPKNDVFKILAKEIGSNRNHVAKLLTGLNLLEHAADIGLLKKIKIEEDDIPFSLLTTGIGYGNICEFIGLKGVTDIEAPDLKEPEFEEFFRWVFEKNNGQTVLGESRKFEKLARIVLNGHAIIQLRQGRSIDEADLLTDGPLEAVRKLLTEAEYRITTAQSTLSSADGFSEGDVAQAERIMKAARSLYASLQATLNPAD